jgi:hypothetical protein
MRALLPYASARRSTTPAPPLLDNADLHNFLLAQSGARDNDVSALMLLDEVAGREAAD